MLLRVAAASEGSWSRTRQTQNAETRKLAESTASARGAVSTCTSKPPSDGPAICATEKLVRILELASSRFSRPTSDGSIAATLVRLHTEQEPARNATTYNCSSRST